MNRDVLAPHPVEALSALIDGEIGAADRAPLEAHLEACAGCRDLLEDLRAIDRSVAAEPVPSLPPDLARRITAAIPRREAAPSARALVPASRRFFRNPMPLAAAASLAVATLVWLAWPGGRPAPEPAQVAVSGGSASTSPTGTAAPAAAPSTPAASDAPSLESLPAPPVAPPPAPRAALEKDGRVTPGAEPPRGKRAPASEPRQKVARSDAEAKEDSQSADASLDRIGTAAGPAVASGAADLESRQRAQADVRHRESGEVAAPAAGVFGRAAAEPGDPPAATIGATPPAEPKERNAKNPIAAPWPRLLAEPYSVRWVPADAMRVESGAYVCSVPLQPEDVQRLTGWYAALRLAPGSTSPAAERMQAIRVTGTSATGAAAPKPSAAEGSIPVVDSPPVEVPPEARAYLLSLVRDRYRAALEQQCGPLPR